MSERFEIWLAQRLEIQPARAARLVRFLVLATVLFAANSLARTAAEALFLANVGASALATYLVLVGVVVVPAAGAMSRQIDRMPKAKLVRASLLAAVAVAGLLRALAATDSRPGWFAVLIAVVLGEVLLNIQFWVLLSDYFTSLEQKRLVAVFTLATAGGGMLGGVVAGPLAALVSIPDLLLLYPVLYLVAAGLVLDLQRREQPFALGEEAAAESIRESLRTLPKLLREYPIVALMAVVGFLDVFLGAVGSVLTYNVYARELPDERRLAQFLGVLKAGMCALQVVLATWVTRPLVQKLGVGRMNVLYPLTTLASLVGLAVRPTLPVAVATSANWDAVSPSVGNPVENLTYNAVPPRFLGRVRAVSEGMLQPSGLAVAGVALAVLFDRLSFTAVAWLAVGASLLHVALGALRGSRYADALASQLSARALDLESGREKTNLPAEYVEEIERLLTSAEAESTAFGLELAARHDPDRFLPAARPVLGSLAGRGVQAGVTYLSSLRGPVERGEIRRLIASGEPRVQALALEAALWSRDELPAGQLQPLFASPDARVRGLARAAALRLGGPTAPLLLRDPDLGDEGLAAVTRGARAARDRRLIPSLVEAMVRGSPETRATALDALAEMSPLGPSFASVVELAALELESESPRVRAGAYRFLARERPGEIARVARGLGDTHAVVRRSVANALGELGDAAIEHLGDALGADRPEVVQAALEVLGAARTPAAVRAVLEHLAADQRRIQGNLAWLKQIPAADERWLPVTFALEASDRRAIDRILGALSAFGLGRILRHARQALRGNDPRLRANAVEALAAMPERRFVVPVLDLLEALASGGERTITGTKRAKLELEELFSCDDPWVRVAAVKVARRIGRPIPEALERDPHPMVRNAVERAAGESIMSRLLFLRQISLFQALTLDELFALDGAFRRVDYLPGETIFEEGSVGDDFYLISEGTVAVCSRRGGVLKKRAQLARGDFFGEMALFDDEPRSATCLAETACALLALDRNRLFSLIEQMPQIGLAICKTMTQRLRRTERDLRAAVSGEMPPLAETKTGG